LRILALDVGERRIGVALSDPSGTLASPLTKITRRSAQRDIQAVLDLAQHHDVERIVVGLPLSLDGSVGPQAKQVQRFVRALAAQASVPVETWDERLSTWDASQRLRETGVRPSRERARLDAAAATIILQSYLDAHREKAGL
jgi:putative Holliday junction resolvase